MHQLLRCFLHVFAVVFLFCPALFAQQSTVNSDSCPCTLRGTVIDSVSGQPIHGALVSVHGASVPQVLTDAEGKFQFSSLPGGPTTLLAVKPGYSPYDGFPGGLPTNFTFDLAPGSEPPTIKLFPEGIIFGKVTDENGEPLEGFTVAAHRNPINGQQFSDQRSQVITDDEGKFRFADLSRGSYYLVLRDSQVLTLAASKNSSAPQGYPTIFYPGVFESSVATSLKVVSGKSVQANFSLKREPFIRISGTVTGYHPQEEVQLSLQSSTGEPIPAEISFSPSTGAFQSKWIAPGSYTLWAQSLSAPSTDSNLSFSAAMQPLNSTSDVSGIHLTLQPATNISIKIHGDFGKSQQTTGWSPLAVALVPRDRYYRNALRYSAYSPRENDSADVRSLLLPNVLPGTYSVQIISTGLYYPESATWGSTDLLRDDIVIDASGSVPPIEITVREGVASISGSVSSGDQRATATVFLLTSVKHQPLRPIPTDARGAFTIPGLAPGTYRVLAVDDPSAFDLENPDVLAKLSTYIQEVTLAAKQAASVHLELAKVGE